MLFAGPIVILRKPATVRRILSFSYWPEAFPEILGLVVAVTVLILSVLIIFGVLPRIMAAISGVVLVAATLLDFHAGYRTLVKYITDVEFVIGAWAVVSCLVIARLPLGRVHEARGRCRWLGAYFGILSILVLSTVWLFVAAKKGLPSMLGYFVIPVLLIPRLRMVPWILLMGLWCVLETISLQRGFRFTTIYVTCITISNLSFTFALLNPNWLPTSPGESGPHHVFLDLESGLMKALARFLCLEDRHNAVVCLGQDTPEWQELLKSNPHVTDSGAQLFYARSSGLSVGDVHTDAEAFFRILHDLGGMTKLASCALILPVRIREILYSCVLLRAKRNVE